MTIILFLIQSGQQEFAGLELHTDTRLDTAGLTRSGITACPLGLVPGKEGTEALQREPFTGQQGILQNALPGVHNLNGLGLGQGEAFG